LNPYGDVIQEHFRHPHNYGSLEAPDIRHEDVNPFCGDRVRIELSLGSGGEVSEARFQGDLCMIAKAASSILTDMITGMPLTSAVEIPPQQLLDALGAEIRPARLKCALLPLEVLRSGVEAHRRKG
jgi:nitrogen fixation protein NifU and related proteins